MLKFFLSIVAICFFLLLLQSNSPLQEKQAKIYINQLVEHPALDATTRGIVDGLFEAGYVNGKNMELKIEFSQGNMSLAGQIATKFVSNSPDVVVGVATIAAQSFAKFTRNGKTKLIFTSVTDPIGANLVKSIERPGNNTSGVSNFMPLEPQLKMFKCVIPFIKKLGFLYNPGEVNSISLIKKLEVLCPKFDIELVTLSANKTSEVAQSAIKLSSLVDAIFISNDNTALSAFRTIIKAANGGKVPVFVSDTDIAGHGAIVAFGPNQYELGKQTAKMIIQVLNGKDINNMKVEFPEKMELFFNKKLIKKLGVKLPCELLEEVQKMF